MPMAKVPEGIFTEDWLPVGAPALYDKGPDDVLFMVGGDSGPEYILDVKKGLRTFLSMVNFPSEERLQEVQGLLLEVAACQRGLRPISELPPGFLRFQPPNRNDIVVGVDRSGHSPGILARKSENPLHAGVAVFADKIHGFLL